MATATVTSAPSARITTRSSRFGKAEERYAHLFEKLRRPAIAMVRGAFGSAFSDDELEDFYSSAWLSTLAAFDRKPRDLADDELRRYLMTAVANQAARELRRRGRRPTVPLDTAAKTSDAGVGPDEIAAQAEQARVTREVIGSLPARRRAVLVYRYGWDLQPSEVCDLLDGLSPRTYRKEIEKGVAEVAKKMRMVEEGDWCTSREPLLRAVVAGVADDDEERQARQHIANCRSCAGFVGRLNGHLHELGAGLAVAGLADRTGLGDVSLTERAVALADRAKHEAASLFGRGGESAEHAAGSIVASGGTRGAGVASAGALAKLAGLGAIPKVVAACIGTGAAATACVAAGVVPGIGPGPDREPSSGASREPRIERAAAKPRSPRLELVDRTVEPAAPPASPAPAPPADAAAPQPAPQPTEPAPAPAPEPAAPPPTVQEFEAVGTPVGQGSGPSVGGSGGGGGGGGGGDFGP